MSVKMIHIPITKIDSAKRLVYGVAALQQKDKTGETFHYESSVPYFQEWSDEAQTAAKNVGAVSLGNVREMHGKSAAGKLTQLEFNDSDKQIEVCAKVVDDAAWTKVEEGVYTGFSIGGDYVRRWNEGNDKMYTARPSEISLVDNPAMPGAHFSMVKMNGEVEERSFVKYAGSQENINVITNDMVTNLAQQMAKAAGTTGFGDFIFAAREQLEKAENPGGVGVVAVPLGGGLGVPMIKPDGSATITTESSVENNTEVKPGEPGSEYDKDGAVKKPNAPGNTADGEFRGGSNAPTHPEMGKTVATNVDPRNEVQQGWAAKDGSFHLTKAAAISHNAKLDSPSSLLDAAIGNLSGALGKALPPEFIANEKKKKTEKDMGAVMDAPTAEKPASTEKAAEAMPYGDVKYADPGYKADKKHRYPLDTAKHVRAAWSYIHMPKNHKGYTAQQVDSIKSKITAAWNEIIGGEPPAAAEKSIIVVSLQKGMYTVSRLACLIEELNWLHESCESEAEWEKDNSPVPAQLKGDIASLVGTLKNMVDEETSEMFDDEEMMDFGEMLEMAANGVPALQLRKYVDFLGSRTLNKSATISKAHAILKAAMPKEHMAKLQEMHDHCCSMGAKCDEGNMGKAAGIEVTDVRLAKGMELLSAENAELRDSLTKAVGAINSMAADIQSIKDQPVVQPPSRLSVIEKGADFSSGASGSAAANELSKQFSPDLLATAAVRLIHGAGGQQLFKR